LCLLSYVGLWVAIGCVIRGYVSRALYRLNIRGK
jgi:hypothetical protein